MNCESVILELERMGAAVDSSCDLGGLVITYAGVNVDVQIEDQEIRQHEGHKFARLDNVEDVKGLINNITKYNNDIMSDL